MTDLAVVAHLSLSRIVQGVFVTAALALAAPASADVFTWVDAQGILHFSDHAAEEQSARRVASLHRNSRDSTWNRIERDVPEPHVVPLERRGGVLHLQARLAGVEAPFVLDTGAEVNVIPLELAREIGLELHKDLPTFVVKGIASRPIVAPVVTVPELRMGSAVLLNVEMVVLDNLSIGFLGMPVLDEFRFTIDPQASTLVLEENDR